MNESYLRWLRDLARTGIATGLTPLDLARDADLGRFGELTDSERLVANLRRAYHEEDGGLPGAHLPSAPAFADMASLNGGRPPTCLA